MDFRTIWGYIFDHFRCQKHQKSTMKKVSKNMCEMLEAYRVLGVSWVALGGLLGLLGARVLTDLRVHPWALLENLQSSNPTGLAGLAG